MKNEFNYIKKFDTSVYMNDEYNKFMIIDSNLINLAVFYRIIDYRNIDYIMTTDNL